MISITVLDDDMIVTYTIDKAEPVCVVTQYSYNTGATVVYTYTDMLVVSRMIQGYILSTLED